MIKALKVVLIIFGVIMILEGLTYIIMPDLRAKLLGFEGEVAGYVKLVMAVLGATWVASGVWVIVAGQDPLRHINWVKFAITGNILVLVVNLYAGIRGYVDVVFSPGAILCGIFAVLFLAFYPWRKKPSE